MRLSNGAQLSRSRFREWRRRNLVAVLLFATLLSQVEVVAGGLINISSRGTADRGADALVAGFVIAGSSPKKVLVRGAGPALGGFNVAGALVQVRLDLYRGTTLLGSNAGWDTGGDAVAVAATARAVGAFAFAAGSGDAALLVTLVPGNYSAQVSPGGSTTTAGVALVEVYDVDPASPSRLINLSTRAKTGSAGATLIAGFVVAGEERPRLLVRAAGPALTAFGVPGVAADPQIEIFQDGTSVGFNDNWQANAHPAAVAMVSRDSGAFPFTAGTTDAALLLPGAAGAYTAQVTAASGGIALVEVYDTAGQRTLPPGRVFDLVGFGRVAGHGLAAVSGGGVADTPYNPVTRTGNYWRIDDATIAAAGTAFATQLQTALGSDQPLVVEINTMLDLSRFGRTNIAVTAIAHPDLLAPGRTTGPVGTLNLGSNKTIYSAYGNGGFRRGSLRIDGRSNIILRNLKFREFWEWDDATRGDYDRNDWDYLTVISSYSGATVTSRAHHIWVDHCDFEKSYDGLFDFVHGADLITVSWCKIAGVVSGETARWVQRQMDYLEANRGSFPYYNSERAAVGMAGLVRREAFQSKSNLVGNATDATTAAHDVGYLNVTFHHNWYVSVDQRMPRLRYGNAHVFNLLADSSAAAGVSGLNLAGVTATSNAAIRLEHSRFIAVRTPITINVGLEPAGRVTVVNSVNTDTVTSADRGFDATRTVSAAAFQWNVPAAATGLSSWPVANSAVMPAGYVPPGRQLADYIDAPDYLLTNPMQIGVLVPADAVEAEQLRRLLQATTAPR